VNGIISPWSIHRSCLCWIFKRHQVLSERYGKNYTAKARTAPNAIFALHKVVREQNNYIINLCRASSDDGLLDLGDLVPRPEDRVASTVLDELRVFVLHLGPLPDLNLAATTDNTNTHRREQVVGTIAVEIYTAVEHGGGVLAETTLDERPATGVLADERCDIVNNSSNSDKATAILDLLNIVVPLDDGELVKRHTPVKLLALLVKLLLELLDTALLDLVGAELLEVAGKTELAPEPDAPFGGIVLVPFDGIAVVAGEFVVEVVVALAEGDECGDDVIPRAVAVIERLITEPVGKGVDAESGLLDEEDAENASIDEATHPVVPANARHESREDHAHDEQDLDVVLVLPDNDGVLVQVGDVGAADALRVLLHDHPTKLL
jgi:hypothetical protein